MKVIYYYHYLFYKNILGESDPKSVATFVISFDESIFLNCIIGTALAHYYCISVPLCLMLGVFGLMLLLNFLFVYNSKKANEILKVKPKFYGSHGISVTVTCLYVLMSFVAMYWLGIQVNSILAKCKG